MTDFGRDLSIDKPTGIIETYIPDTTLPEQQLFPIDILGVKDP